MKIMCMKLSNFFSLFVCLFANFLLKMVEISSQSAHFMHFFTLCYSNHLFLSFMCVLGWYNDFKRQRQIKYWCLNSLLSYIKVTSHYSSTHTWDATLLERNDHGVFSFSCHSLLSLASRGRWTLSKKTLESKESSYCNRSYRQRDAGLDRLSEGNSTRYVSSLEIPSLIAGLHVIYFCCHFSCQHLQHSHTHRSTYCILTILYSLCVYTYKVDSGGPRKLLIPPHTRFWSHRYWWLNGWCVEGSRPRPQILNSY